MQVTQVSAFSLKMVLGCNARGQKVVGYTVRPGYSTGLCMQGMQPRGHYVGFSGNFAEARESFYQVIKENKQ